MAQVYFFELRCYNKPKQAQDRSKFSSEEYMLPMQPLRSYGTARVPQPSFSEIKFAAKSALKNRWGESIAVSTVMMITFLLNIVMEETLKTIFKVDVVWTLLDPANIPTHSIIASACITVFSVLFSLLVTIPLLFGTIRWFWLVTAGQDPAVGEVFYCFSNAKVFLRSMGLSVGLFLRVVIGVVLCFLPYIIVSMLTDPYFYVSFDLPMPSWMASLIPIKPIIELISLLLLLLWFSIYALYYAVMLVEPNLSGNGILKRAAVLSRRYRVRFVGFTLSFLGWFALGLAILPLLFVIPFYIASLCIYGREIYRSAQRGPSGTSVPNGNF